LNAGLERSDKDGKRVCNMISPTREALAMVKRKALRCGVWFKALSRNERILMELVIRVTDRVRSFLLAKLLSRILEKLLSAMGGMQALMGKLAYVMETEGRCLAHRLSRIAEGWGNRSAAKWRKDAGFIQYLAVMHLNKPL
jgi:hypothetical protein